MSSENSLTFVLSNRGIKNSSTAHQIAIYDGYQYRFKENNKNSSRYICTNTECQARVKKRHNVNERIIAAKVPTYKKMSPTLQKIRSSTSQKEPKDLLDLEISGQYAVTNGNEIFLRYDNKSRKNRIIIFVDNQYLKILSESDQWFMDGTFKCSPIKLMQLFTIHPLIKNLHEALILNPKYVMADFEKASRHAIQYHFPNIIIKGCWFHFKQAIFRRAVRIGLKQHYSKDEYRDFINLLGALALIPIEHVQQQSQSIDLLYVEETKPMQEKEQESKLHLMLEPQQ
ncbi:unnamed protein product [Brachionus calyciflorus]|uniref:MULE transposase domain-containing protein n=1 Tax=Brachionus calyciflorus TaxID=104777 RepID=A0A814EMA1_9BILA|nr:unnamed protein product [Brachionus calyciflorus]